MTANTEAKLTKGTGKKRFLYRQLADLLKSDIQTGKLVPGDMLPSMDELSRVHKINKATVRQAFAELIAAGYIYSVPAKGTFVTETPPTPAPEGTRKVASIGWISSVCINGVTGRYHAEIIDAVRDALTGLPGHLVVLSTEGVAPSQFCQVVGEADLDAAILVGPFEEEPVQHLLHNGMPTVLIDDQFRGQRNDTLLNDNHLGGFQAAEHLVSLGHKNIVFVTGPRDGQVCMARLAGAQEALEEAGIDRRSARIIDSDFTPEGGYASMLEILKADELPSAVFFFNDEMAFGAYRAVYENSSLRVPDDISFVGFDNISWASMTHPPLTTVHVERRKMGAEAVARLGRMLNKEPHTPSTMVIPTRLEIRQSTAPAHPR